MKKMLLDMLKSTGRWPEKPVISLVGAGGKTTCAYLLAEELAGEGKKVLVTTTTHMEHPNFLGRNGAIDQSPGEIPHRDSRHVRPGRHEDAGTAGGGFWRSAALF